jgi:glucose/arabinose dehydrogenase
VAEPAFGGYIGWESHGPAPFRLSRMTLLPPLSTAKRYLTAIVPVLAVLAGLAGTASAATYPASFEERTIVSGLTMPTAVDWTPDGRVVIVEKGGKMKVAASAATTASTVLDLSAQVNEFGDRGMLGVAVDSSFASNHYVYLLFTYELDTATPDDDGQMVSRLLRVTLNNDDSVTDQTVVLGSYVSGECPMPPSNTVDCLPSEGGSHSIGTVLSAPDGTLYVGSGDASSYSEVDTLSLRTYNENSPAGKIMHIDRAGRGLSSHAFCPTETDLTKTCTKLFAKGFRNPFRFALRPDGDGLTVGDVGWASREEVNLIRQPGRDYGWPCYEGNGRAPGYKDLPGCAPEYAKEGTADAAVPPNHDYDRTSQPSSAVMGGPTYTGSTYPSGYRDSIFFADYAQGFIKRLTVNASDQVTSVQSFATEWGGNVQIKQAPDGDLVFVSFGTGAPGTGSIQRIAYSPGNGTPTANGTATPSSGNAPLTVSFSSAGSSDPDSDTLTYAWDFGDGSPVNTTPAPSHLYADTGTYSAKLTVDDGRGRTNTKTFPITVGNGPPSATITAPADGTLYTDGESIQLDATGTDPQDGTLAASAFSWRVTLHHATHTHPFTVQQGVRAPIFVTGTDHDADSYYEINLTVTDSTGLTDTDTILLRPRTSALRIDSIPAGAPISYSGVAQTAPFAANATIGYRTTVTAGDSFTVSGRQYTFDHWSDGGAQVHNLTIPSADTSLTAVYAVVRPQPVLALGFDEASGATAVDGSGRGNSGSISGATRTTGRFGGALNFDGVNDWVQVADASSLDMTRDMTLEAWVNPRSVAAWRSVLMKEAPPDDYAYAIYGSNSQGNPGGYAGAGNLPNTSPLALNTWSHIAFTNDAIGSRLYINGELVGARPSQTAPATAGVLHIGGNSIWNNEFFPGLIDEVRIYDKALSEAEVNADMTTPIGSAPGDTTPPTVAVTSPAGGSTVSGGIQLSATASDDVGVASVQFRLDGNDLGAPDTSFPYAATWDTTAAGNGTHKLTAVARDSSGNPATSAEVSVTVSNGSPSTSPVLALGFDEGSGASAVDASGTGNTGAVQGPAWTTGKFGGGLSFDGVNDWVQVADSSSLDMTRDMTLELWAKPRTLVAWQSLLMKEAPPDDYAYSLYATNSVGNPGGYAGPGNLPAPTPLQTNAWSHLAFTNDGTASKLYVNGTLVSTGPPQAAPATAGLLHIGGDSIWPGEFFDGSIDEVRVYNRALTAGQIGTDMTTPINVGTPPTDTTPPDVTVTAPAGGATVSGSSVSVSAGATDDVGVASVQFKVDGNDFGGLDTSSPYGATWDTTGLSNGTHKLTAVAKDAAGNSRTSAEVSVTVQNAVPDTTLPSVSMTAPANGATVSGATVAVSATASDNVGVASVQFKLDGNDLGAPDTTSAYGVTWNSLTAANGTHTLTAVAKDAAGNARTATNVSVTVNNVTGAAAPVLALGFNDATGTTARDSSPSANNGTLSGPVWNTGGKFGGALSFDGINDWVTVADANSIDLTTALTLEAWVKPKVVGTFDSVMVKEKAGDAVYDLYATSSTKRPVVELGGLGVYQPSGTLAASAWTHIAATYDGSVARLFVNGTQVAARTGVPTVPVSTGALRIGGNNVWAGEWFDGLLDEIRVYRRALTQADIALDMTTPIASAVTAARRYTNAKTKSKDAKKLKRAGKKPPHPCKPVKRTSKNKKSKPPARCSSK